MNEQGYDILKDELTKNEGSFSKTTNFMLAIDLMSKGEELASTQVTKANLANIIKILCNKLKLNEEPEEDQDFETKDTNISPKENEEEGSTTQSNVNSVIKNSEKVCKFYRKGSCKHGKSGKSFVYSHPLTCKKFEFFGYKEGGCKDRKCNKLHLSLCKIFMKHLTCKYGDKCKYFHPRKLQSKYQNQNPSFSPILTRKTFICTNGE